MIDLSSWPEGSRLILRKERPTRARSWPSPTWTGTASLPCSPIPAAASSPGRWPGWNCGTASRPGRTPHPRGQGSQACDNLPGLGRKQRLDRDRARCRRPHLLGQADLHPRGCHSWPADVGSFRRYASPQSRHAAASWLAGATRRFSQTAPANLPATHANLWWTIKPCRFEPRYKSTRMSARSTDSQQPA